MTVLVGFIIFCFVWLTILTYKRHQQKRRIGELKVSDQENILKIRQLTNEIEYLKMIINGKEEKQETKNRKAEERRDINAGN